MHSFTLLYVILEFNVLWTLRAYHAITNPLIHDLNVSDTIGTEPRGLSMVASVGNSVSFERYMVLKFILDLR